MTVTRLRAPDQPARSPGPKRRTLLLPAAERPARDEASQGFLAEEKLADRAAQRHPLPRQCVGPERTDHTPKIRVYLALISSADRSTSTASSCISLISLRGL